MSKISTMYQGLTATSEYVTVHYQVGNGNWIRFASVKIPIADLMTDTVTRALDRHVRRQLIEQWSGVETAPLFDLTHTPPWETTCCDEHDGAHVHGCKGKRQDDQQHTGKCPVE